jgi:hypothetical protein
MSFSKHTSIIPGEIAFKIQRKSFKYIIFLTLLVVAAGKNKKYTKNHEEGIYPYIVQIRE